jgi:opacity protein-like surface antigen
VKHFSFVCSLAALTLLPVIATAQETPKAELAMGYSYLNVHPTKAAVTSFNMNGGGIGLVYNVDRVFGLKADFEGYRGNNQVTSGGNVITINPTLFAYMFGPQLKLRSHKVDVFGEALFGAGHTSASWSQLLHVSGTSGTVFNSNNSFMMEYGAGLDLKVSHHIDIRPVEVDYLYSRYSTNNISSQQNAFKYFVGLNFNL